MTEVIAVDPPETEASAGLLRDWSFPVATGLFRIKTYII